jgi:hypothetical protein
MLDDPDDLAILGAVLSLATAFRRQVIAEGVETIEHGTMLLRLGCELGQGYGIARPMPGGDFPAWAGAWRPDPAWVDRLALRHDELPLLFAGIEHRAWILTVIEYLNGKSNTPPLPHDRCSFGHWLDGDGRARHDGNGDFQAAVELHGRVHSVANELCELRASGQARQTEARLGELFELRDALLARVNTLLDGKV